MYCFLDIFSNLINNQKLESSVQLLFFFIPTHINIYYRECYSTTCTLLILYLCLSIIPFCLILCNFVLALFVRIKKVPKYLINRENFSIILLCTLSVALEPKHRKTDAKNKSQEIRQN